MLGRLEMDIDECIDKYIELSSKVFRRDRLLPIHLELAGKSTLAPRFDSQALEESVKGILEEKGLDQDTLLKSSGPAESCKVFVCATDASTRSTRLLTTYQSRCSDGDRLKYLTVWQAARATSAASTFFDPIEILLGRSTEVYVDDATGANNPTRILWNEARELLIDAGQELEDNLDCIVSIGTGVPAVEAFGESLKEVASTLVAFSTEAENTAAAFYEDRKELVLDGRYCRLNVQHGLEGIGLEEYQKNDYIMSVTKDYLGSPDVMGCLQTFVSRAAVHERNRVHEELAKPPGHIQSPAAQQEHHFHSVFAHGHSTVHLGDVYHFGQNQEPGELKVFGLCLSSAPLIRSEDFIGRAIELDQMKQMLRPDENATEQRRLVLGGMGGIGKTQLAIAYARLCQAHYTSVFWLNATTESTIKESFRSIVRRLLKAPELEKLDDNQIVSRAHDWLSDTRNTKWCLIFDNYDDPDQFTIGDYVPNAAHGSIIITTRLPELVQGEQVRLQPIGALDESLEILRARSQRDNVKNDPDARHLTERLAGLPLALVTAGAYLRKTTLTFRQYLEVYDQRFNINPRRPVQLQEYQNRTLYTTWNLSYNRLGSDDPLAAKALKLFAYFDNQEIWYELLHAGLTDDLPPWVQELVAQRVEFESAMATLVDYCLLEVHITTGSYSIHSCVHDWTLAELNKVVDPQLHWYVLNCVAASVDKKDLENLGQLSYARLTRHAVRCAHHHFGKSAPVNATMSDHTDEIEWAAELLAKQVQLSAAGQMYIRALGGREKALGPDHTSTLDTVQNLGTLYRYQGKRKEAEQMYLRALRGREKALGPDHCSTLDTFNGLGALYHDQGKLKEAEQMYLRALGGRGKARGPDHTSTLNTINNLGTLYADQGKLKEAKQMYLRALGECEKALRPDHTSTLLTVNNLGILYRRQGKLKESEQMYLRAIGGFEKALGPHHSSTLSVVNNLGLLYADQGKLKEAEQMHLRALGGYEKALGPDHRLTLNTINNIGLLSADQGKLMEAEQMYLRAIGGFEKALGPHHSSTLNVVNNLGALYTRQGKLKEAEQMYLRALGEREKSLGLDHPSTLDTVNNLGLLHTHQGKLKEAEHMYLWALGGYEKALGPDHPSTLRTVNNLGLLYADQGKLKEAEHMCLRALGGYEKALGPDHPSTLRTINNLRRMQHCLNGERLL